MDRKAICYFKTDFKPEDERWRQYRREERVNSSTSENRAKIPPDSIRGYNKEEYCCFIVVTSFTAPNPSIRINYPYLK
jgi:hypothetical protein